MAFESGVLGFRMFYVPGGLPAEAVSAFAEQALPPVDSLGREPVHGWVTGRHLLDRAISDDTAVVAGYLRLTLAKAERKIPNALLRAECRMEELAELAARDGAYLKRHERAEIKKMIIDRLLPQMPPTLTGIPMVYDDRLQEIYAGALSEKQADTFVQCVRQATGVAPIPLTPESAAMKRKRLNVRNLQPACFSPESDAAFAGGDVTLGRDFLTWLWYFSEACGGTADVDGFGTFAVALEGPLTFAAEGRGAHETVLRKGSPLISAEAKTALTAGKKLVSARVNVARGDDLWSFALAGDNFVFRGVRMPTGEAMDPVSRFHERMMLLETLKGGFLGLFDRFVEDRAQADVWQQTEAEIHAWVRDRKAHW